MSNHYSSSLEWGVAQNPVDDEDLRDDDDDDEEDEDLPVTLVTDESSDGYFTTFDPPAKPRDSTSSFFSEGRRSLSGLAGHPPRGASQERHASKDRFVDDRAFSIRMGEGKEIPEPRRLSSPLVPMPSSRIAQRQAQSFHAIEDLRSARTGSLSASSLDQMLSDKVWRRSTGDAVEALRRKDEVIIGARSSPIGTPVASTRRYTNTSSRNSSPAVTRELDLQNAAENYLKALSLDPKDESPVAANSPNSVFSAPGADPTWHFPGDGPPSPLLPRSSRVTSSSPRVPNPPKLALELPPKSGFDAQRSITDSPNQFARGRLSNANRNSPLATPRTLSAATAAAAAARGESTTFTRSPLTQRRSLNRWDVVDDPPPGEFGGSERYELPPRLMTPPRESLSEQLQQALQHHQHHYALNVITGNSLLQTHNHERQCFMDEACPICLRTEVQPDELMVVLRCKLLACNHVAHSNCFKEAYLSISQHPFTFFKVNPSCVPIDQTRFVRGPRSGCIISLGLFHILSEVQFGHFKVENLGSTYDPQAEQDCLNIAPLAETSTGTRPLFSLRRGRLMVECQSPTTAERWRFQANYDLTGANSCVDLVFVDSESKVSVQLSIIINSGNTWAIERLTIELPPPPLTKRISSSPQMLQQRLSSSTSAALSPHTRLSPSVQPTQPPAAQAAKGSQRLLQVQDSAKSNPKHFKFPPSGAVPTTATPEATSPNPSPPTSVGGNNAMAFDKKPKIWDLPPNFASFEDHIPSLATTQLGSRFLQRKVEEGNPEFLALLFEQLIDFLPALIVDLFGNYLCQSMVCYATEEQRYRLLVKIKPHLVPVACARQGTRMVQKLVELSTKARDRRLILEALTGAWPNPEETTACILDPPGKSDSTATSAAPAGSQPQPAPGGTTSPSEALRNLSLATSPSTHSAQSTSTSSIVLSDVTPPPAAGQITSPSTTTVTTSTTTLETDTTTSTTTTTISSSTTTSTTTTTTTIATDTTSITSTTITTTTTAATNDEEIPNWQVTDKAALLTLMKGSSGAHVIHAILDHWPVALCRPIIHFAFELSAELGVHQHGLCVLKKCLTVCTPEDLEMFVSRIQPQIFTFINDPYGNYLIQHLLERCDSPDTDPEAVRVCSAINWDLHRSLQGHYPWLSRQKFSSNVVEKCLRTPDLKLRSSIIEELTRENTISQLLQCSFGNYVMQHVLEVASPAQAAQVIARIQPDLRLLRKNIRKKWERLLLRYDADAVAASDKSMSPVNSETNTTPPSIPSLTPSSASSASSTAGSQQSAEMNSQLLAHNRNLANEFRAFQAMQDSAHAAGEYNEHKTGSGSRKPRKAAPPTGRPGKEFVPEAAQPSTNVDQARFRPPPQFQQQYVPEPYGGYAYPAQPSYVPYTMPRTFPATTYVQPAFATRDQPRYPAGSFRPQLTPQQMQMMPEMQNHS